MVSREVINGGGSGTPLPPIQASGASVVVPDAHLLFTAEFSRIGDDLLLTGQDGTTSDQGPLRARRIADAAVAAQDDDAARVGRRFCKLEARGAKSFPARKRFTAM